MKNRRFFVAVAVAAALALASCGKTIDLEGLQLERYGERYGQ